MNIEESIGPAGISIPDTFDELLLFFQSKWVAVPMITHEQCLQLADTIIEKFPSNKEVEANVILLKGNSAYLRNKNAEAMGYFNLALAQFQSLKKHDGEGACYMLIGACYRSMGNIENALVYIEKGVLLIPEKSIYMRFFLLGYYQGAEIFSGYNKLQEAFHYYNKALNNPSLDSDLKVRVLNGIGNIYLKQGKYDEALSMLQEGYELVRTRSNKLLTARILSDLGNYYYEIKDFAQAYNYELKSYELRKELGLKDPMITNLIHFSKIAAANNETEKSIDYINQAYSLATDLDLTGRLAELHGMRASFFENQHLYNEALQELKKYISSRENELNASFDLKINGIKALHEVEFAQKEAELTREKNTALSIANEQINNKNIELQETLDELTKTRISKKAITITIFLGIGLFIFEEVLISPVIDNYFQMNILISIMSKGIIALALKPIEAIIEKFMLNSFVRSHRTK